MINLYQPNSILLPEKLVQNTEILPILKEYIKELCKVPGSRDYIPYKVATHHRAGKGKNSSVISPSEKEQEKMLVEGSIPIFFDVFQTHSKNKFLALGPAMPELWQQIGKPHIFHENNGKKQELSYIMEEVNPARNKGKNLVYSYGLNYLLIDTSFTQFSGKLIFEWPGFSKTIKLQKKPYVSLERNGNQNENDSRVKNTNNKPKLTLVTLQKDNPTEWIKDWCEYYHTKHGVNRIIIYNNKDIIEANLKKTLNNLLKSYPLLELWTIPWHYTYTLWFTQCQTGALTHAYWQVMQEASYFLNFDIDEFLVNSSNLSLQKYLEKNIGPNKSGLLVDSYIVPNIRKPKKKISSQKSSANSTISIQSIPQRKDFIFRYKKQSKAAYKTIFPPQRAHRITVHRVGKIYPSFIVPILLMQANRKTNLTWLEYINKQLAQLFHSMTYLKKIKRIKLYASYDKGPAKNGLYFLHYQGLNNNWKWGSKNSSLELSKYNPQIHIKI